MIDLMHRLIYLFLVSIMAFSPCFAQLNEQGGIDVPAELTELNVPCSITISEDEEYDIIVYTISLVDWDCDIYVSVSQWARTQYYYTGKWIGYINGNQCNTKKDFISTLRDSSKIQVVYERIIHRTDNELITEITYCNQQIIVKDYVKKHPYMVQKIRALKDWFTALWCYFFIH